jgi:hypothetical protein
MKFLENFNKLFERKNNYQLFHKTASLKEILNDGYIYAGGKDPDTFAWWNFEVRKNVIPNWKKDKFITISATRNLDYLGLPALELDVEKLSDKYKIVPFCENPDYYLDFEEQKLKRTKKYSYFQDLLRTKSKEASKLYWRPKTDKSSMDYGICEELILTDEISVRKYVKRIILEKYSKYNYSNNKVIIDLIHSKYPNIEVVEIDRDTIERKVGHYNYINTKLELKKQKEKELEKDKEVVLENINDVYKQDILDEELLKYSENKASLEKMRELIKAGANVNCTGFDYDTPLINASKKIFYSGIKLLIDNNADVNLTNKFNETPLTIISQLPQYTINKHKNIINKIIDLFIENNINLNIKSKGRGNIYNYTALDYNDYIKEYIKNNYPEKYEEYLMIQNRDKYNL